MKNNGRQVFLKNLTYFTCKTQKKIFVTLSDFLSLITELVPN